VGRAGALCRRGGSRVPVASLTDGLREGILSSSSRREAPNPSAAVSSSTQTSSGPTSSPGRSSPQSIVARPAFISRRPPSCATAR
jgi:hypothetical protein